MIGEWSAELNRLRKSQSRFITLSAKTAGEYLENFVILLSVLAPVELIGDTGSYGAIINSGIYFFNHHSFNSHLK
jgi:hypothetical protein